MDTLNHTLNFIAENWAYFPLAGALSLIMAFIFAPFKKWFEKRSETVRDLLKITAVFVVALIGSIVHYVLASSNPDSIPIQSGILTLIAQPWWIAVYKPLIKWSTTQWAKIDAYNAQLKSAAEPVEPTN